MSASPSAVITGPETDLIAIEQENDVSIQQFITEFIIYEQPTITVSITQSSDSLTIVDKEQSLVGNSTDSTVNISVLQQEAINLTLIDK